MTSLVLPITSADLSRRIAAHWGGERGVARCVGENSRTFNVVVGLVDMKLLVEEAVGDGWVNCDRPEAARAIRFLLDALEDEGLAVDRESGRVLGWAAVPMVTRVPFRPDDGFPICDGYMVGLDDGKTVLCSTPEEAVATWRGGPMPLVAIVSLDITDPRRSAYFDAVLAARLARRAPVGVDAKREGALRRWMATYGGGVR